MTALSDVLYFILTRP